VVLLLVLLLAAPLAAHIPLCAMAAILFVVAWNMSEWRHCLRMVRRAPRADVVILLITFALTVFADLVIAVNIGVLLAMLHFLRRMSQSVSVRSEEPPAHARDVLIYTIEGPFFFGATEALERTLAATHTDPRWLILRLGHVPFMDITGIQALEEALSSLRRRHVRVLLCEANERVHKKLADAGLLAALGDGGYHGTLAGALAFTGEGTSTGRQSTS
jgi:SulP family sulfate permease